MTHDAPTATVEPVEVPDVATQAHPAAVVDADFKGNSSEAGQTKLQDVLPEINDLAKKVGGFKKLAKIANDLDEMNK
jgi:hypothetical protein